MPDKEELEQRITEIIDDRENTLDAKITPCYNDYKKEERYAERS